MVLMTQQELKARGRVDRSGFDLLGEDDTIGGQDIVNLGLGLVPE
jgi:hypothetical protein